ncbi:MAG: hypothetical protein CFE23_16605 [Flavobacterium sp. BFFFF1]|uniref:hypothetical protein n=1 Tax=Flavobacterium sp. BFFFF1 TaxID=2015557 RepID=UPI000BCA0331|nr:hypothetical protein [Flavobacterium sp. BFFFF1]OYU78869.1 MAG: hypothetical protein CFE23_16605 [Flavobacterium sp. BFFFF1]
MKKLLILLPILLVACQQEIKKTSRKREVIIFKTAEPKISESDIYEVLNSLNICLPTNSIYYSEYNFSGSINFIDIIKETSKFKDEDLKFIRKQLADAKNFNFNISLMDCKRIIPKDTLKKVLANIETDKSVWKTIYKKYGKHTSICQIGLPLFSLDKQYVIFTVFSLIEPDSFGRSMVIYKRVNNKWQQFDSIPLYTG